MLSFELPWVFYLLPLPILAYWLIPKAKRQQAAVVVPFYDELVDLKYSASLSLRQRWGRRFITAFIWCCLIVSAAAPTWIGDPISLPTTGRDLLLAVDISGSMNREDMRAQGQQIPRIIAVKAVLSEFIEKRIGDRLGLILFGTNAYLQAPLTFDRTTVKRFMTEAQIGFAGEQQTAIGDAIGLAVKRLRNRPGERHVVILLTDGANNGGEVNPIPAAKLAAQENIVIYTIGVGADEMVQPGIFGSNFGARKINPSADLDEETLREIAKLTGGRYFRARDPQELIQIYQLLDSLEPVEDNEKTFRPQKALYFWPLTAAMIMSLFLTLLLMPWKELAQFLRKDFSGNEITPDVSAAIKDGAQKL
ncbi:MAG: Ca-activated chloride channel family protein [Gammaproteobacteria bacterium]|jgi:Ca-activated chloride channel family protein